MDTFGNDLSSGGQVLSREELVKKRQRHGQCPTCGERLFKRKLLKFQPITVPGKVLNGRCLACHPQDPNKGEELVASCAPARPAAPPNNLHAMGSRSNGGGGGGEFAPSRLNLNSRNAANGSARTARSASGHAASIPASFGSGLRSLAGSKSTKVKGPSQNAASEKRIRAPQHKFSRSGVPFRKSTSTDNGEEEEGLEQFRPDISLHSPGSPDNYSSNGNEREGRVDLERNESAHRGQFLQRPTPRPSMVLLDGLDITKLFDEEEISDSENGPSSPAAAAAPSSRSSQDSSRHGGGASSAISRITMSERQALRKLASDSNSFVDIVDIMIQNSMSASVQNEGLHALSLIHDPDPRLLKRCAASCGFEVIVSAMGKCQQDAMAQTNACKVLFIASAAGEDLQISMGRAGGIEALVDAMKVFEDDAIVLEGCLLALSNLCIPEENLPFALGGELIELAVNAMSRNVENCGLQEHGCAVLANLAVHGDARARMRDCGGCDTVVVSMVVNPMDVGVQCQALVALRNLAVRDAEVTVLLANAGAIDVVIQAMQNHRDDAQLQARGAWVLGIMGANEDNKLYIGENGGSEVIITSMWHHPNDIGVQEKASRALWTLSVEPKNRYTMMEMEIIPAIISAMQHLAPEPSIQERGFGVMSNLAANDDDLKVQIVEEGALEVIVMAMVLHGENEMIQERAVALLHKLCIPENIERMVNANVSPMMAVVAENFPDLREKASYVLTQLQ